MTHPSTLLTGLALSLCVLASASAAPPELEIEFDLTEDDVSAVIDQVNERLELGVNTSSRMVSTTFYWSPNKHGIPERGFVLRTLFARDQPLSVDLKVLKEALFDSAVANTQEASLGGTLTRAQSSNEAQGLEVLGRGPLRFVLYPSLVVDRTETGHGEGGATYEVIWRGTLAPKVGLIGRPQLLRRLVGQVRVGVEQATAFHNALENVVRASYALLEDDQASRASAVPWPSAGGTVGVSQLLGGNEATGEAHQGQAQGEDLQREALQSEYRRVGHLIRYGNLVGARVELDRLRQEGLSPDRVRSLSTRIQTKQRRLEAIMATARELKDRGGPTLARRLVESYYFSSQGTERWKSSTLEVYYAGLMLNLRQRGALNMLKRALRKDPALAKERRYEMLRRLAVTQEANADMRERNLVFPPDWLGSGQAKGSAATR